MKSMTGFGCGEISGNSFSVSIELKTVNNRFLDVNLRLSNELLPFEMKIKKIISERLSRGRVDVALRYERTGEVVYELNRPLILGYLEALKKIQHEFSIKGKPDLNMIARLPGALQQKKNKLDEDLSNGIRDALMVALDNLEAMRHVEGLSLKDNLESLLFKIEKQVPVIETESGNVPKEYFEILKKRIEKLLSKSKSQIEIDQAKLTQEVAYLSDKSDISEEITRIKSHIKHFHVIINEDGVVGKKLDFLAQELNREVNTISSKTQNMIVKTSALKIKSDIEKIREQVQNIE